MASLYEIDSNIQAFIDGMLDATDENGEIIGEIDYQALEALQAERREKLENIALYMKNLSAEAAAIKDEEDALKKRRERIERKCERLGVYLAQSMVNNNEDKLESAKCSVKIRTSKSTEIDDLSLIPVEYIKVTVPEPVKKPDKVAIKKAIEAGKEVAGAHVVINKKAVIE